MLYQKGNRMSDRIQIKRDLEIRIIKGEFPESTAILSVTELSAEYQISPTTAVKIYEDMKNDGTLSAQRGSAHYVTEGCKERLEKEHLNLFRQSLYSCKEYADKLGLDFASEVENLLANLPDKQNQ